MNQEQDKWIEEVLQSTAGMEPVRPRPDVYGRIASRLGEEMPAKRVSLVMLTAAAACLLVLLTLNLKVLDYYHTAETEDTSPTDATVGDIIDYYELGGNTAGL